MSRIILRLECFHDDVAARRRALRRVPRAQADTINARHVRSDLRVAMQGDMGTWVAEVIGMDRGGRLQRRFVEGLKDYSCANSVGSRGVHKYYVLTEGPLYEIVDRIGYGKPQRRRYCRVVDGKVCAVEIGEVLRCLP
jgi:hypothetical protein